MGTRGGARPGAGRKPKTEKFATAISRAEKQIADKLPVLIDSMMELAQGVRVEEYSITQDRMVVYQRPPDRASCEYLINRIMGKPTEKKELNVDLGEKAINKLDKLIEKIDDEAYDTEQETEAGLDTG